MGEFDVARIKSMFEKGPQNEPPTPKRRTQERRRTIATYGLSPGIHAQKKSIVRNNNQKQVRIAPIPGYKKDLEKKDVEEKRSDKPSKPSTTKDVKTNPEMDSPTRRMTMPTSYSFLPPKGNKKNVHATKKSEIKSNRDVKDKDSSPKSIISSTKVAINNLNRDVKDNDASTISRSERQTRTIRLEGSGNRKVKDEDISPKSKSERQTRSIKPTFSGKRSFFDRQSSTASDPKPNIIRKPKVRISTASAKNAQETETNVKAAFKSESKPTVPKKHIPKSPRKSPSTAPNKVSKFAYASAINKEKRASFVTTGHAHQKKSSDAGQSQLSPFPLRRQSLSDLPLPEHESVDISDFHRSLNLRSEDVREGSVSPKKEVTREKDMNLLKDRKTVTSMIQQFSTQPTPIQGNKSNRVKDVEAIPEPPPIQEDSYDQNTMDGSEIIEEVTVVSEYTPSSSRHVAESDDDEDYSYEEVTATEADEYTETDSFMLSSVGMETASRVSYTPSLKSQRRVVVDFQNMEMTESKMKEKHLKVVKDLEMLMTKTANQPETKVQRTIKDKMLQDLLHTNKSIVPEGVRQSLLQADLTIHEVSEIVAHMNMCEETKSPVRWDLIKAIVFPDGIDDETDNAFEEAMKQQGGSSNLPPISTSGILPKKGQPATPSGTLGGAAAQELFRNQYDLSKDDMADIVAHLTLCEETGTEVRWDLIYQIVYPEDDMGAEDSQTDPGSMMIDFDDNETVTSWYSIYPEKSECGSEITFNIDEDDKDVSLPRIKTPKESGVDTDFAGKLSPQRPKPAQRGISDSSDLANKTDDQLLRKRIQQLQQAAGGKAFQVHRRKKDV